MNRTFQHRLSLQSLAAVLMLAVCALWCFLVRTSLSPLLGLACMLLAAAALDRMLHTEYVLTPDNRLIISRGRLGGCRAISIGDIVGMRPVRGTPFVAAHVVIEYGVGRVVSVQPSDAAAFISELRKRLPQ